MIIPLRLLAAKYGLAPMTRILHVGGHYGEECDEYEREGATQIAFFEPSQTSFAEMVRRIGDRRNVNLVNLALGNANGPAVLNVETANAGQSSSLLKAKIHATQYPGITFDSTEAVGMVTLDWWTARFSQSTFSATWNFLALDVQGYELEVLRGGEDTLKGIRAISAEINREELYEGCGMVDEVDAFLGERGFDRVETEWCGGTWGEGIYVRRRPA
jgi:FkbM family methyltransferase